MVCKELTDILCDFIEGTLDPEIQEEMQEHFEDCPPCRAFLNTYKKTSQVCRHTIGQVEIPRALEEKLKEFARNKLKKTLSK